MSEIGPRQWTYICLVVFSIIYSRNTKVVPVICQNILKQHLKFYEYLYLGKQQ
jgi:hypothetical protein